MNLPTNIADKIAVANTLASYLSGTDFDLATELAERGLSPLAGDIEFSRVFTERVSRCHDCGLWVASDASCDCDDGDWDDYE